MRAIGSVSLEAEPASSVHLSGFGASNRKKVHAVKPVLEGTERFAWGVVSSDKSG